MGRRSGSGAGLEELTLAIVRTMWQFLVIAGFVVVWIGRRLLANHPEIGEKTEQAVARSGIARRDTLLLIGLFLLVGAVFPLSLAGTVQYGAPDWICVTVVMFGGGVFILYKATTGTFPGGAVATPMANPALPPPSPLRYTLRLPVDTEWNPQNALHLVEQLAQTVSPCLLSLEADSTAIRWHITALQTGDLSIIEPIVRAIYPNLEVEVTVLELETVSQAFFRLVLSFKQMNLFVAPLSYVTDIKAGRQQFDPLAAFTQAMNSLQPGERVRVTLGILGVAQGAHQKGEQLITQSTIHPLQWGTGRGIQDALTKKLTHTDRIERFVYEDQRVLEEKLDQKLYHCVQLLQIDAVETRRAAELISHLASQFTHFDRQPFNALDAYETDLESCITYVETSETATQSDVVHRLLRFINSNASPIEETVQTEGRRLPTLILEPREIAALWHLPHEAFTASRIAWGRGLVSISERVRLTEAGVRLGQGTQDGVQVPVSLATDDRVTHMNLIGRTGTGKSTLLHHLIHQDIAVGAGVIVIDPHGSLVQAIMRTSIPEARSDDVVLIDLGNPAFPPPLNPLRGTNSYAGTQRMMSVIERLFDGLDGAPRMANYLRSALLLLQADTEATLRDIARVLLDDAYRESLLNRVDNPELEDFWDMQFNATSAAMRQQIAEPILSRIRPFYANPYLYPMLCHPDALDFGALLREEKIVLISLAVPEETVHGQERDLLGALLMTQLQIAAMREPRSCPIYVYVDEVQRFVTTSLSEVLAEARKFGVVMTTANQYLGQLTGKTLEAVMGNVGTTVVFGCSPEDANALALYMKPEFTAQKLVNLDRFSAAVKMQVKGTSQPAFSLLTDHPLTWESGPVTQEAMKVHEMRLRQTSQERYIPKSREIVHMWLKARYPRRAPRRGGESSDEATFYE